MYLVITESVAYLYYQDHTSVTIIILTRASGLDLLYNGNDVITGCDCFGMVT